VQDIGAKDPNVIEARLGKGQTAKYPIRRVLIMSFIIPTGFRTLNKDNVFVGGNQLPKRLVMGMVQNEAFNGSVAIILYKFEHFNLRIFEVFVNGKSAEPNFETAEYTLSYMSLQQALKANTPDDVGISLADYKRGYTLWGFNLTPDKGADEGHRHLIHSGSMRIDAQFGEVPSGTSLCGSIR
jgi:hypothetical protein